MVSLQDTDSFDHFISILVSLECHRMVFKCFLHLSSCWVVRILERPRHLGLCISLGMFGIYLSICQAGENRNAAYCQDFYE
jgi:hypothetical protein